ncbi:MAG: type II secretion system F family protein, partial [Leptonema sp. (in: Bacteria)]|nr:type II secretion system F family protein [Leptonema sp. (in: bacteria)]
MPVFRYQAVNKKGKNEKGILDAAHIAAARQILRSRGLIVRQLAEDEEKRDRELFPFLAKILYRVPRKDVALFTRQLGTLLEAGIPLDRSLQNITEQTENPYLKKALIEMKGNIIEGEPLSTAMAKHDSIFPDLYANLVSVGEQTGTYEKSLLRLADLEEANLRMKNKVFSAILYPLIMMVVLGTVLTFLMTVVIPQIQELFASLNAELPFITRFVIGVSNMFSFPWIFLPIVIVAGLVYGFQAWVSTATGRRQYEELILAIPLVGSLMQKSLLARFSRNLGVMLESRVSLIVSLQVCTRIVDHTIFAAEIKVAIDRIREGSGITDAFRDSVILTHLVRGMLSAGEATDRIA